jgi:iron complex outermembrane receptor protein
MSVESKRASYSLEVALVSSDSFSLTLRNRGLYQDARRTVQGQFPFAYDFFGLGSLLLNVSNQDHDKQLSEYLDLYGKFSTAGIKHQLIIAGDLMHSDTNRAIAAGSGFATDATPVPLTPIPDMTLASLTQVRQYGLMLQDQMTLGRFHALAGLRETFYKGQPFGRDAGGNLIPSANVAKVNKLSFNGGLVYDVSPAVSVYFSYSNGFNAPRLTDLTVDGSILPPEIRTQYEIGLKSGLFGDRLTLNISANKFSTDSSVQPDVPNPGFVKAGPGIDGKGLQVSLAGSLTPTLKVLAGYSYSESKKPNNPFTGLPDLVTGVPNHVANLWAIKTFRIDDRQSIDLGLGGNYNSGFTVLSFLDGQFYTIDRHNLSVNGSLAYKIGAVTVNVVVNNIFDRRNYQPSGQLDAIQLDTPRSVRATMRVGF